MEINKSYKVRLYPNESDKQKLLRVIGACRFVWNYYLAKRKEGYLLDKKTIPYRILSRDLTNQRKENEWLAAVNRISLESSLRRLDRAYGRFFRKISGLPRFKTKKDVRQSFQQHKDWRIVGNKLFIAGMKIRFRGMAPDKKEGTVIITSNNLGRWHATFQVAETCRLKGKNRGQSIGIDMGIKDLAVLSNGKRYKNISIGRQQKEKIAMMQRSLSRKRRNSNRRNRAKVALARLSEKIRSRRLDYLHKVSHRITQAKPKLIACEDLSIKNMMGNHKLAYSISDASWGILLKMLEYKQIWNGGAFKKIDRYFPSSKTCHNCHFIVSELSLSVRKWKCPNCKKPLDRDTNAAKVILQVAEELPALRNVSSIRRSANVV